MLEVRYARVTSMTAVRDSGSRPMEKVLYLKHLFPQKFLKGFRQRDFIIAPRSSVLFRFWAVIAANCKSW